MRFAKELRDVALLTYKIELRAELRYVADRFDESHADFAECGDLDSLSDCVALVSRGTYLMKQATLPADPDPISTEQTVERLAA